MLSADAEAGKRPIEASKTAPTDDQRERPQDGGARFFARGMRKR